MPRGASDLRCLVGSLVTRAYYLVDTSETYLLSVAVIDAYSQVVGSGGVWRLRDLTRGGLKIS